MDFSDRNTMCLAFCIGDDIVDFEDILFYVFREIDVISDNMPDFRYSVMRMSMRSPIVSM